MRGQLKIIGGIGEQVGSRLQDEMTDLGQNCKKEREMREKEREREGERERERERERQRELGRERGRERRVSYILHPHGDHESVAGLEQPDSVFVSNSNQTMTVHINQLITNLHVVQFKSII